MPTCAYHLQRQRVQGHKHQKVQAGDEEQGQQAEAMELDGGRQRGERGGRKQRRRKGRNADGSMRMFDDKVDDDVDMHDADVRALILKRGSRGRGGGGEDVSFDCLVFDDKDSGGMDMQDADAGEFLGVWACGKLTCCMTTAL